MTRFTLHGSPHSLPTYKVALMLRLAGAPFSFRYVSFQRAMHLTREFHALSRWGQVPVLVDGDAVLVQSGAIIEHLARALGRFEGRDPAARQAVREWMYWEADALFPPVFGCYGVELGERKLLPIEIPPAIADYHRRRAAIALSMLDTHLANGGFLCGGEPTIADLACYGDAAFAAICDFDLAACPHVAIWAAKIAALPGFQAPFDLLAMRDLESTWTGAG